MNVIERSALKLPNLKKGKEWIKNIWHHMRFVPGNSRPVERRLKLSLRILGTHVVHGAVKPSQPSTLHKGMFNCRAVKLVEHRLT